MVAGRQAGRAVVAGQRVMYCPRRRLPTDIPVLHQPISISTHKPALGHRRLSTCKFPSAATGARHVASCKIWKDKGSNIPKGCLESSPGGVTAQDASPEHKSRVRGSQSHITLAQTTVGY
ncbi:hypothetical protein J6590_041391 [Homalodisca vitripennis]|nr:hypothetical protein J6590_041391 [Homalodisca vitripennis]